MQLRKADADFSKPLFLFLASVVTRRVQVEYTTSRVSAKRLESRDTARSKAEILAEKCTVARERAIVIRAVKQPVRDE